MASYVQYVNSNGNVNYNDCRYDRGVRPFWDGRRNKVGEIPKLESHHQKNKHPFLRRIISTQDKYKGIQKRKKNFYIRI